METKRQWMQSFDGRIRVGPEYQAMIPPFCKNYQSHQNDINPKDTQEPKPTLTQSHSDPLQSPQSHQPFTQSYEPFTQSYEPFTESYEQLTESLHQCEEYEQYENVDLEDQCDISSHIKFVSEEELGRFESDTKSLEHYNSDKEF